MHLGYLFSNLVCVPSLFPFDENRIEIYPQHLQITNCIQSQLRDTETNDEKKPQRK